MHAREKYAMVMASNIMLVTTVYKQSNEFGNSQNNNYKPVILNKKV